MANCNFKFTVDDLIMCRRTGRKCVESPDSTQIRTNLLLGAVTESHSVPRVCPTDLNDYLIMYGGN